MWVKICGNTSLDDCLLAAELGADAIGFVFAAGKRTVTAAQVAPITEQLPHQVEKIGVFTSGNLAEMLDVVQEAGLTGVQVHSAPDYRLLEQLRAYFGDAGGRCSVIQVLPWYVDAPAVLQADVLRRQLEELARDGSADALLIDSRTQSAAGGTGMTFDWNAAREVFAAVDYRMIAAGGLTPENVSVAIETLRPWGVDISSGVEVSPGKKEPAKLEAFLRRAKETVQ